MARPENPQGELIEVIDNWGFDPQYRGAQDTESTGHNICVLPVSEQVCSIISNRPLTVIDGRNQDYRVDQFEPRILGHTDDLNQTQALLFSKYGTESLVPAEVIFPEGYFNER